MKKFGLILLSLVVSVFSCNKYDDTAIWDKVNELDNRVSRIERTLQNLNTDIVKMQVIVDALQKQVYITSVKPITGGFRIVFSNGDTYEIMNGQDGQTPYIGGNGNWWIGNTDTGTTAAGSDGQTPYIGTNGHWWIGLRDTGVPATGTGTGSVATIGVREYNGRYYWTQTVDGTTTWLTDQYGNKIPVSGEDGNTPVLRVSQDGYWMVSYDKGVSYEFILDADGNKVKASCDCESFFRNVTCEDGVLILVLMDGTVITFNLNEQKDSRMDDVVPPALQEKISKYIPLYSGINPPMVEGCYLFSPTTCVYCEDEDEGGYEPGEILADYYIRFTNQNSDNNTVDFSGYQLETIQIGNGAFICGHGDYFTAYFDTDGYNSEYDITFKTALVISGTMSAQGIKDLYYAFIMVEKHGDTEGYLMKEGVFRVFDDGDGLSENTQWPLEEEEKIDLGLPSGVQWAWCNLGADSPEECGYYFAWGEVNTKTSFTFENYKWLTEDYELSKYNLVEDYGPVDGKRTLELSDDAAYKALGAGWRMPTITDWIELFSNCNAYWTSRNGMEGYELTSINNGRKLFLPAGGGYENGSTLAEKGTYGLYWSSSMHEDSINSYAIAINSTSIYWMPLGRPYGYSVRPVYGSSAAVPVKSVGLNRSTLSLSVGESATLTATVNPSNATNKQFYMASDNKNVASVTNDGVVTAEAAGTTIIRVYTLDGGKTASCTVTVSGGSRVSPLPSAAPKSATPKTFSTSTGYSIYYK